MILSITSAAQANSRPTSVGDNTLTVAYGEELIFSVDDFTTDTTPAYADPEGDALSYIQVQSLPESGALTLSDVAVVVGDFIYSGNISTGNFVFTPDVSSEDEYSVAFTFDVADEGSASLSGITGDMTVTVSAIENEPPDSVGDNTINGTYSETIIFTSANFTTETVPAYSDPEDDAAYLLKILSLPSTGDLYLNGTAVILEQEILFTEIDTGYFLYVPDSTITESTSLTFDFSIADAGSLEFTE